MIRRTPSGGLGNMQFYNGPAPRVETVMMPSPLLDEIRQGQIPLEQPYPDPYNMITGIGMQNYGVPQMAPQPMYQQPMYQPMQQPMAVPSVFAQQIPQPAYQPVAPQPSMMNQIPISPGGGIINGIYSDVNQPIRPIGQYGGYGIPNGFPIQNYYNPYMGVGVSFGYGTEYVDPEDMAAKAEGFENAAEKMVNEFNVHKMIAKAAYIGAGCSQEEVDKMIEEKNKKFEKTIEDFKKRKESQKRNGLSLGGFSGVQQVNAVRCTMKVKVVRGDEVLAESDPSRPIGAYFNPNAVNAIITNIEMNKRAKEVMFANMAYMYANAVERQLDKEDSIDFFNHGINLVHHKDKDAEWYKKAHCSKQSYSSEEFRRNLVMNHGTPQDQIRFMREQKRREKLRKQKEEEERDRENKVIMKGSEVAKKLPFSKEVAAGIKVTEDGKLLFTVPDFVGKTEQQLQQEKLDDMIDEFLEEFAGFKPLHGSGRTSSNFTDIGKPFVPYLFSQQQQPYASLLNNIPIDADYMKHYYTSKSKFIQDMRAEIGG